MTVFYLRKAYLKRLREDQLKHLYELFSKRDPYLGHEDAVAPSPKLRRVEDEMIRRGLLPGRGTP